MISGFGTNDISVVFQNGVRVKLIYTDSIYPTILVSLPGVYASNTIGLCGNYNGDDTDDLHTFNGTTISSSSSLSTIYYSFGLGWRVPEFESLFNYTMEGLSYIEVNNDSHVPAFTAQFSSQQLQGWAELLCGPYHMPNNLYLACLFDIAATDDLGAGESAIQAFISGCQETSTAACLYNTGCPNYCNYHGICNNTMCTCIGQYVGTDCFDEGMTTGVVMTGNTGNTVRSTTGASGSGGLTNGATTSNEENSSEKNTISFVALAIVTIFASL